VIREWKTRTAPSAGDRELQIKLIAEGRRNIAEGRNRAAREAHEEILTFSDVGCELDRFWAERLLEPFVIDSAVTVSMGWYKAVTNGELSTAVEKYAVPQLENIDPQTFLPSGRSLAFRRSIFVSTGGYPEYLSLAGEDSLFDFFFKTQINNFAFVPDAIAFWKFPDSFGTLFRMIHNYAKGDAEGGKLFWLYYFNLVREFGKLGFEVLLWLSLRSFSGILHFSWFSWLTFAVFFAIAYRYLRIVLEYRPFTRGGLLSKPGFYSFLAAQLVIWAQLTGFLRGMQLRARIEKRQRELAQAGHLFVMTQRCLTRDEESTEKSLVRDALAQGFFITNVFQTPPKEGSVLFDHAAFQSYLRSHFDVDAWRRHEEKLPKGTMVHRDLVNDSLSRTLILHLEAMGFRPAV